VFTFKLNDHKVVAQCTYDQKFHGDPFFGKIQKYSTIRF